MAKNFSPKIIDGVAIAKEIENEIKECIDKFQPKLCVISIDSDEGINAYVNSVKKVGEKNGVKVQLFSFDKKNIKADFIKNIDCDGIVIARPIPKEVEDIVYSIPVEKDIDCLHPTNLGKLFLGTPLFEPSTPLGVIEILNRMKVSFIGKNVVIIGRSNNVGKPLSIMLARKGVDATVTLCHTKTKNLKEHTLKADILISCAGSPFLVKIDMVNEGAIVIDVGINFVNGKLVGDVDFENVKDKVSMITPVPGGVGPVTTRVLLRNLITACKLNK